MRNLALLSLLLVVAGCADQRAAQMKSTIEESKISCQENYASYTKRISCINSATSQAAKDNRYPYMDLVNLINTQRASIAKRVEKKQLSAEDADLRIAQIETEITSEELHRRAALVNSATQMSHASAANASASAQLLNASRPQRYNTQCSTYLNGPFMNTNCY